MQQHHSQQQLGLTLDSSDTVNRVTDQCNCNNNVNRLSTSARARVCTLTELRTDCSLVYHLGIKLRCSYQSQLSLAIHPKVWWPISSNMSAGSM